MQMMLMEVLEGEFFVKYLLRAVYLYEGTCTLMLFLRGCLRVGVDISLLYAFGSPYLKVEVVFHGLSSI